MTNLQFPVQPGIIQRQAEIDQAEIEAHRENCERMQCEKSNRQIEERLPAQYPYLIRATETLYGRVLAAKNIRIELEKAFPYYKFSVKSESYAGGNSVGVSWDYGPTVKQIDALIGKYEEGTFDGMTDCYDYNTTVFNLMFGACKYAQTSRHIALELTDLIGIGICELQGMPYTGQYSEIYENGQGNGLDLQHVLYGILSETTFPAGFVLDNFDRIECKMDEDYKGNTPWKIVFRS